MPASYLRVPVTAGAGATTEIVAAIGLGTPTFTGRSITVHGYHLTADVGSGSFQFQSSATNISGQMRTVAGGNYIMPPSPVPIMKTAPGEPLNLATLTAAITGFLIYGVD